MSDLVPTHGVDVNGHGYTRNKRAETGAASGSLGGGALKAGEPTPAVEQAQADARPTRPVNVKELDSTMTLVGDAGGTAAIYDVESSSLLFGMVAVETEHGTLYLDPDLDVNVLDED